MGRPFRFLKFIYLITRTTNYYTIIIYYNNTIQLETSNKEMILWQCADCNSQLCIELRIPYYHHQMPPEAGKIQILSLFSKQMSYCCQDFGSKSCAMPLRAKIADLIRYYHFYQLSIFKIFFGLNSSLALLLSYARPNKSQICH